MISRRFSSIAFLLLLLAACAPQPTNTPVPPALTPLSNATPWPTIVAAAPDAASTITPPPSSPSLDLPLSLGNTWVYSSTKYDTLVVGTAAPGQNNPGLLPITATEIITESVVETQTPNGYFAAQILSESSVISSTIRPGSLPALSPDDYAQYTLGWSNREVYWYIKSGAKVYRQTTLDVTNLESAWLELILPLAPNSWYPDASQRKMFQEPGTGPSSGARVVDGPFAKDVPAGHFENCYGILTIYLSGGTRDWFCSGIGFVGGEYDHQGSAFGYAKVLMKYSIETP